MKKLLLILLCLPIIGFGQQTYVPDDNFEIYLEANGMGNGIANDDSVLTSNINTVTFLDVSWNGIVNLSGIEDFTDLETFVCIAGYTNLNALDVSNNHNLISLTIAECNINSLEITNQLLTHLYCFDMTLSYLNIDSAISLSHLECYFNQLSTLDVSKNTALTYLDLQYNYITSLNLINNTALTYLDCSYNFIDSLNLINNTALTTFWCQMQFQNKLTLLELRNGNNMLMDTNFHCFGNPNLFCINVDDSTWSATNWTSIDPQHYFSNNCSGTTGIQGYTINKELLKLTDLLGRETKQTNQPLFYIYDDGTVEKRIVIE